ncbi:MAG: SAM-dependent methyltransferase [Fournierella sp.]|uniref:SAM-dependent methyltransferase n=1 Tax=Allofournierella sp. TaxID=1940256 RepID=UPI002A801C40|nr:SAM-dependent methyltransferase [Fournierella sp.]MDY4167653.1 SAM-dependent methyltransferase [Fournierella sp.]
MGELKQNYYGSLCTEMYEILQEQAPQNELDFYLSYAEKGKKILEPLCGSGRFLVPFLERGFDISGMDLSGEMLAPGGTFVFAVDTVFDRCEEDSDYKVNVSVKTKEGYDLILKGKNHYDEKSQTQFSPSIYELYRGAELLQSETMDFQTHLYQYGEMDEYLRGCGFQSISVYSSYRKEPAVNDQCEMLIYECS